MRDQCMYRNNTSTPRLLISKIKEFEDEEGIPDVREQGVVEALEKKGGESS